MAHRTCSIEGCERDHIARGWCNLHYQRWRRHRDPTHRINNSGRKGGRPRCAVESCPREVHVHGYCSRHIYWVNTYGDPLHRGKHHPIGSPFIGALGYVVALDPTHPTADTKGYVQVHRRVAWDLGLLHQGNLHCVVHHVNHVRTDNRPGNLEVLTRSEHASHHIEDNGYIINQFGTWPLHRD